MRLMSITPSSSLRCGLMARLGNRTIAFLLTSLVIFGQLDTVHAQSEPCVDTPAQQAGVPGGRWTREGLLWRWQSEPPPSPGPISLCEVEEQVEAGCTGGEVYFGDIAMMRAPDMGLQWDMEVRRNATGAALEDRLEPSQSLLEGAAQSTSLGEDQRAALDNLRIQTALQFSDHALAEQLLVEAEAAQPVSGALASDRLFWRALLLTNGASVQTWRNEIDPLLRRALEADPAHFSVRVYLLIAWLKGERWTQSNSCNTSVAEFSNRVLAVSKASACPLLVGHIDHAIGLATGKRSLDPNGDTVGAWQSLATGIFGRVAENEKVWQTAIAILDEQADAVSCAKEMRDALVRIQ